MSDRNTSDRTLLIAIGIIGLAILALLIFNIFRYDMAGDRDYQYGPFQDRYNEYGPAYSRYGFGGMGMGPGMMDNFRGTGYGFSPQYMRGPWAGGGMGMMAFYLPDETPITEAEAKDLIESFSSSYGGGVVIDDFMAFSNNYYARLVDTTTGEGLEEVLVDRYSGALYPEPGPNMVWNTLLLDESSLGDPAYDLDEAETLAETFLEEYLPGSKVMSPGTFPGYYTFDFGRDEVEGMLSVNAYTGEVWIHTWHGFYLGGHEE